MRFANRPSSADFASAAPCRPFAAMTSITASACVSDIRPFSSARRVNSPGPAGVQPAVMSASNKPSAMAVPPWTDSSITSSPV